MKKRLTIYLNSIKFLFLLSLFFSLNSNNIIAQDCATLVEFVWNNDTDQFEPKNGGDAQGIVISNIVLSNPDEVTEVSWTSLASICKVEYHGHKKTVLHDPAVKSGTYTRTDGHNIERIKFFWYNSDPNCAPCKGGLTNLTLKYNGSVAATIQVDEKGAKGKTVYGPTEVQPGGTFSFEGSKGDKKFEGNEITITIDGDVDLVLHTSCSVSVFLGSVFGSFTVMAGTSKDGGPLCQNPLPVEMTSFSVTISNNLAQLNWETATEINNYGFEIQRSTETTDWNKIGFVDGHGNSNSPKFYAFTDNSVTESGDYF
ncbi:MAG: hypothetical protein GY931_01210, partial [Maribacter sp.]|nr:hypothetical protein [Maribacter sp.]